MITLRGGTPGTRHDIRLKHFSQWVIWHSDDQRRAWGPPQAGRPTQGASREGNRLHASL